MDKVDELKRRLNRRKMGGGEVIVHACVWWALNRQIGPVAQGTQSLIAQERKRTKGSRGDALGKRAW